METRHHFILAELLPEAYALEAKEFKVLPPNWVVGMLTWCLEWDMADSPEQVATCRLRFIDYGYYRIHREGRVEQNIPIMIHDPK